MSEINLTIDGKPVRTAPGTLVINAAKQVGIEIPSFCYYDGLALQAACRMCLVEVEKTPKLQVGCTLPVAEGHGSPHRFANGPGGSQRDSRIPAHESSFGLPGVRQGRRMRAAGHDLPLRRGREPFRGTEAPRGRAAMVAGGLFRRTALHPLLPLRSHLRRGHGRERAGRDQSRRSFGNRSQPLRSSGVRRVRHVHRYLPGRRIDQRHVSLQDAALGNAPRRHYMHALFERLQDHSRRSQQRDHPRQQSRSLGNQRRVPVHQGTLRIRFRAQPGAAAIPDVAQERRAGTGILGGSAGGRGAEVQQK